MWSPSSGSLMEKVNVTARAAHTNSTPSLLCPRVTFSTLFPLSLCKQSWALTWSWLKGLPLCQSCCCSAPSACCSGSLCSSPVGWSIPWCPSPLQTSSCSCIHDDFHKLSRVYSAWITDSHDPCVSRHNTCLNKSFKKVWKGWKSRQDMVFIQNCYFQVCFPPW